MKWEMDLRDETKRQRETGLLLVLEWRRRRL